MTLKAVYAVNTKCANCSHMSSTLHDSCTGTGQFSVSSRLHGKARFGVSNRLHWAIRLGLGTVSTLEPCINTEK